ncbi:MAG: YtxH domain-containing protein [Anaerolineales bacterium]
METGMSQTEKNRRGRSSSSPTGSVMLGLLTGALAGAAAGLLLAPRSGEETKAEIRRRGEELRDDAEHTLEIGRERADSSLRQARSGVAGWLQKGSDLLEEQADQLRQDGTEERVLAS